MCKILTMSGGEADGLAMATVATTHDVQNRIMHNLRNNC